MRKFIGKDGLDLGGHIRLKFRLFFVFYLRVREAGRCIETLIFEGVHVVNHAKLSVNVVNMIPNFLN